MLKYYYYYTIGLLQNAKYFANISRIDEIIARCSRIVNTQINKNEKKCLTVKEIKLIAFDMDGTLTQHKTHIEKGNRELLDKLSENYKLLMVGAGQCRRIFEQMEHYPIDIIGNYGMQYCRYNAGKDDLDVIYDERMPCDRESVDKRITMLRQKFGYTDYVGDNVEYHISGCVTFPLLGTKAAIADKLSFDPDRKKRRAIYESVKECFSDYTVFVGGSSSFDFAPYPYNKYYALDKYCRDNGLSHENIVYVGDDYGLGGNDEAVYKSDIEFICVDDYRRLREALSGIMK